MKRGSLLLLFYIVTATARSNDSPTIHGGSSIGYVRLSPPDVASGIFGLPQQALPYPASLGSTIDVHAGATFPLSSRWSVRGQLAMRWNNLTYETTEPTLFNVNGTPTPGTFTHTLDHDWTSIIVGASALFYPSPNFAIAPTFDLEVPTSMSGTATESITDPPGVTYTNGDTSRIRFTGSEQTQLSLAVALRFQLNIRLSNQLSIEPYLALRQQITSLTPSNTLLPTSVAIGVDFAFQLSPTPSDSVPLIIPLRPVSPDSVQLAYPLPDSVPLRPTTPNYATPFLATRLDVSLLTSTSRPSNSISILTKRRLLLISNTTSPSSASAIGDDGIEPTRRLVDTVIDADPPRMIITSTTIADSGFRSGSIAADIGGTNVWSSHWQHTLDTTFTWELNTLPGDVLSADTLRIQLASVVHDSAGTSAQSLPRYVTLTRKRINASQLVDKPDFVDATFTKESFRDQALTNSGVGLVTAVKTYNSTTREIEMSGPESLVNIVRSALDITPTKTTITKSDQVRVLLILR